MPNAQPLLTSAPYRETPPPSPLAGAVACIWTHGGSSSAVGSRQTIVPDNCADIIWRLSPAGDVLSALVAGPMSRPFVVPGSRAGHYVGVRFLPGQLARVLRVNAADVRDQHIPVDDILKGIRLLLDGLAPSNPAATLRVLAKALGARILDARTLPPVLAHALFQIDATQGQLTVEALARRVGASRQHLARIFDVNVGLRPKFVARVVRLQHAMAIAIRSREVAEARSLNRMPHLSWSAIAAEVGYADQSHMVADFMSLTGTSPAAWLAAR
ncbi:MAG: helix-turn-helix transcriptional regulator [Gemmatimonadaceae bacterium]